MDVIKTLVSQFGKNLEKQPGWVPLLVGLYVAADLLPASAAVLGHRIHDHREFVVSIVTFLAYQTGDAIDKALFDRFIRPWWERRRPRLLADSRECARRRLGVHEGVYTVALALATAGGKYYGTRIHFFNESAKFARSAAVLLMLAPILPVSPRLPLPWLLPLIAVLLFIVYVALKPLHMSLLYKKATELAAPDIEDEKYSAHDLPPGIRMIFWEGRLVASAPIGGTARRRGVEPPPTT